jgi:hypothetical protein
MPRAQPLPSKFQRRNCAVNDDKPAGGLNDEGWDLGARKRNERELVVSDVQLRDLIFFPLFLSRLIGGFGLRFGKRSRRSSSTI